LLVLENITINSLMKQSSGEIVRAPINEGGGEEQSHLPIRINEEIWFFSGQPAIE
jgi:hypothetical protein